jgi:N-acyl amino acid synthase of PEP-CTERM/exosortase system
MPHRFTYGTIEKYRDQDKILNDIFGLRYQVYVTEWGFESSNAHPEGLEYDDFDDHSVHVYACSDDGSQVIGTIRMILNSPLGFPIERHFDISGLPSGIDRDEVGEISRLAVSKEYRRRAIDRKIFGLEQFAPNQIPRFIKNGHDFRRHCEHELVRGLYIALYRDSKLRGLTHWYAVMAKGLYVILKRWGIAFVQIGPQKDYHGIRAPYLVSIESIERSLEKFDPVLYCEARSGLMH